MKYSEPAVAITKLQNNNIGVDTKTKKISVPEYTGIKLWGAINYLCSFAGYTWTKKETKR